MAKTKIEYRIIGRFRKDTNTHVVDYDRKWTKSDAERRLIELQNQAKWEMEHKQCIPNYVGCVGISTTYYSEYDLLDLKIQSRTVTAWE